MTDPETITRVLSPNRPEAAQMLRDLSVIHRLDKILRRLGRSDRALQQFGRAGGVLNRGNTGCP